MKRPLLFILFSMLITPCFSQNINHKQISAVVARGKLLYQSEMASWYGTDLFMAQYKNTSNVGGYLSYADGAEVKCIFFNKEELPKVIGTLSFDSTVNIRSSKTDLTERELTSTEASLFQLRLAALKTINKDTVVKHYQNMNINLIPLISGKERNVYVLTGPKQEGLVVFGNDYLFSFDQQNQLISSKQLHKNIIVTKYANDPEERRKEIGAMHSHLPETGEIITATDICTLILYEKFTPWATYNVISDQFVSVWDCKKDQLTVITSKAFKKIAEN